MYNVGLQRGTDTRGEAEEQCVCVKGGSPRLIFRLLFCQSSFSVLVPSFSKPLWFSLIPHCTSFFSFALLCTFQVLICHYLHKIIAWYGTQGLLIWIWNNGVVLQHQWGAVSLGSGLDSWSARRFQASSLKRGQLSSSFLSLFQPTFPLSIMYPFCLSLGDLCKPGICLITDTTSASTEWY